MARQCRFPILTQVILYSVKIIFFIGFSRISLSDSLHLIQSFFMVTTAVGTLCFAIFTDHFPYFHMELVEVIATCSGRVSHSSSRWYSLIYFPTAVKMLLTDGKHLHAFNISSSDIKQVELSRTQASRLIHIHMSVSLDFP